MNEKHHIRHALLFGLLASVFYAVNTTFGKFAVEEASPYYILFFRTLLGLIFLIPFMRKEKDLLSIPKPWLMVGRGFLSVLVFGLILFALRSIPVANVVTLTLIYPLCLPFIVKYYFHRKIPHSIYIGIGVGFLGVCILLDPSLEGFKFLPSLLALLGGVIIAIIFIFVRKIGKVSSNLKILFDLYIVSMGFTFIPMILTWTIPSLHCSLAIIGMAISGNFYQMSLSQALKKASSVVVAPMMFFSVIIGMLADYVLWKEAPSVQMLIGTSLIFLGVVITSIINFRHAEHLT